MCEDIFGCTHEPETPVIDEDTDTIAYWICRCGKRCPEANDEKTEETKP
jgi:hypothetical protein